MTYNERMTEICSRCPERSKEQTYGYVIRNLQDDCIYLQNFMSGWELGQSDTIEEIEVILNKGNESRCDDFFTVAEIKRKIEQLKK